MHVPLIQPQVGKDSKGQGILQKEPNILYVFLTNFKFDSQNNPTYPLNSAHSFIVYFYEKLFYLFSTLEMKKINLPIYFTGFNYSQGCCGRGYKRKEIFMFPTYEFPIKNA